MKKRKIKFNPRLLRIFILSLAFLSLIYSNHYVQTESAKLKHIFPTSVPTATPIPIPTPTTIQVLPADNSDPWGVSKQISEYTWTTKVGQDARMATPQEILTALNNYRARFFAQPLTWDEKLAQYAQSRADYFNSKNDLDSHAGFNDFLTNQDGFSKLGYGRVGENSSLGYRLLGVHIIEWIYAGDKPHDDNQKDKDWDHVGIGVSGTATDLIFATSRF